jgi:hypothetical protein
VAIKKQTNKVFSINEKGCGIFSVVSYGKRRAMQLL